jgi:Flp pilus assembly protein TadB
MTDGVTMAPQAKWAIAGVILGLILLIINPWLALAVIVLAISIPTAAWLMLDSSQRRRIKEMRRRQLNR